MLSLAGASVLTAPSLMSSGFAQGKKISPESREGGGRLLGFSKQKQPPCCYEQTSCFQSLNVFF